MADYTTYFQDVTKRLADSFTTPQSEVVVHPPKKAENLGGYADSCRYGASITNPNLEKLPTGFKDALERLELRFKIDKTLEFLIENNPAMLADLYANLNSMEYKGPFTVRRGLEHLQTDLKTEESNVARYEHYKKQYSEKGYLTKEESEYLRTFDRTIRNLFVENSTRLNDAWNRIGQFLKEEAPKHEYGGMGKNAYARVVAYLDHERPQKKDTYDIYLQTLSDPSKENAFGLVLCDGISSQYMTASEAKQIQRDMPNPHLGSMPENGQLKQPQKNAKCAKANDYFGATPGMIENLVLIMGSLLKKAFGMSAKEAQQIANAEQIKVKQEETIGPAPV